jgi:hypothetical protein
MAKPNTSIFIGTQTQQFLRGCGICFGNLPFEINNFDLDAILLSCSVSEVHELP